MKKRLNLLVLFLLMGFFCQAKQRGDYYVVDSTVIYGVVLLNYGLIESCQYCNEMIEGEFRHLSPEQVSEFGYLTGEVYVAKVIQIGFAKKKVFLEKRTVGDFSVYHYKDKKHDLLFLQFKDGGLNPLFKPGERDKGLKAELNRLVLKEIPSASTPRFVEYNPTSIVDFISRSIGEQPRLRTRIGFGLGYGLSSLSLPSTYFNVSEPLENDRFQGSQWATIFVERALTRWGLCARLEGGLSNLPISYHQINGNKDVDFVVNKHALDASFLLKYSLLKSPIRPYLITGISGAWNFLNENFVFQSVFQGNVIEQIGLSKTNLIDRYELGPTVGFGLEIPYHSKNALFVEARYFHASGIRLAKAIDNSTFLFSTGITF